MITKWGEKILSFTGFGSVLPAVDGGSVNYGIASAKDKDGNNIIITPAIAYAENDLRTDFYGIVGNSRGGYLIGSDGTAATDEDYTLGSRISTFSNVKSTGSLYDAETNTIKNYVQWTITNTGSESFTIREIVRDVVMNTASAIGGASLGGNGYKHVIVDRTVLENPVEIPAGQSAILRYECEYL